MASPSPEVVSAAIRDVFRATGAEVIKPPLIQDAAPYLDLSGEDIRSRLVVLESDGEGVRCLRPDLTIPVTLAYLDGGDAPAQRAYRYEARAFRSDPDTYAPQEFVQFGLERFGDPDPLEADTRVLCTALEAVRAAGVEPAQIMFGDAQVFSAFIDSFGLSPDSTERLKRVYGRARVDHAAHTSEKDAGADALGVALSQLDPDNAAAVLEDVYRLAGITHVGARPLQDIVERLRLKAQRARADTVDADVLKAIGDFAAIVGPPSVALDTARGFSVTSRGAFDAALDVCAERFARFDAAGVSLERALFSMSFARQFDYYDAMVFELQDPAIGARPTLAGGGRYDGLAQKLGAEAPLAAVGCMVRPDRVRAALLAGGGS